jgi:hypothetical protein
MTQIEEARKGRITPEMDFVATREKLEAETVRAEVALGRMVIPANREHLKQGLEHQGHLQDQREHRQLRRHFRYRQRAGQAPDGRRAGLGHGDGPFDRR